MSGQTAKSTVTFYDVIDKIHSSSKNSKEIGDKFEKLIYNFLTSDGHYMNRFVKVWMWDEYARENGLKKKVGMAKDLGVDIVARERNGVLCAIQCKCWKKELKKGDVDSFVAAGRTYGMDNYMLFHTSSLDNEANVMLAGVGASILNSASMNTKADWIKYTNTGKLQSKPKKNLFNYQQKAFEDVTKAFGDGESRGKMIMACGTGKTMVSLRIAESITGKKGGVVLYLVPSISLISQSMREWSENAVGKPYFVAVCSDKSIKTPRDDEQGTIFDLEVPPTTNSEKLAERLSETGNGNLTVIFSTYHSVGVVQQALKKPKCKKLLNNGKLDIIFCDEAHRTTGVDTKGEEKSYYTKAHYDKYVPASRRLYMTATPRIYLDSAKEKAEELDKDVISMDDESVFGRMFHNLTFYDAVHKYKALCDFKVRVAYMDADTIDRLVQEAQAGEDNMIPLNEKTLMSSVWHALQYPGPGNEKDLLQRVIMFCDMINSSKLAAGEEIHYKQDLREEPEKLEQAKIADSQRSFVKVVNHIKKVTNDKSRTSVDVRHVDGGHKATERISKLEWLKQSDESEDECRILSNARCLSEGVDVPALDGVVFMNPRKSVVDVVQAVGRVMRKSPGKEFGYVILPVAIPAGMDIDTALKDNKYFKIVWQVLNALRSHDPKLADEVNRLTLIDSDGNPEVTNRIIIRHAYGHGLVHPDMPETRIINAISSKLVRKVGDINYYDRYGEKLGEAASTIESRIRTKIKADKQAATAIKEFHTDLQKIINEQVTREATIQVIAQHIVLSRVFDLLFQGEFTSHNPISTEISKVSKKIGMTEELEKLEEFYVNVERELSGITDAGERQNFIKKIYGSFFAGADKSGSEKHGIVYTPVAIIDFILHSIQHILKTEFGTTYDDRSVKILDPFVGAGTFITRLLESGLISQDSLYDKYKNDIHANEIILLAYYIAAVNIETTYQNQSKSGKYVPFEGINYTDTLEQHPWYWKDTQYRHKQSAISGRFQKAHERLKRQKLGEVNVIIGNPPYSAGQSNYNEQNQNIQYPDIGNRVRETYTKYVKHIGAAGKKSLRDSYILSIRWASDRIGNSGIIGFVTNGSFIRSGAAAGIRAAFREEFTDVWVFDLRGNARTQGEERKKEAGTVFGGGSRAPVAITILVKNPKKKGCTIRYKNIGDYHSREKKLVIIKEAKSINGIYDWNQIQPDTHHDWLDQRHDEFSTYLPIGSKDAKAGKNNALFGVYSRCVGTSRDAWAYNSREKELSKNMTQHIKYCNTQNLDKPIIDPKMAKWTPNLSSFLRRTAKPKFERGKIRIGAYRPFFNQFLYFDKIFNETPNLIPKFFPKNDSENLVICVPSKFIGNFSVIITNITPDNQLVQNGQSFPLYVYKDGKKQENITDQTLKEYQEHYNNPNITKRQIFEYVYGLLHHSGYRKKFANNLSREMPHIPMAPDFWTFRDVGKSLMNLHLHYETGTKYDLGKPKFSPKKFTKLQFGSKKITKDGKPKTIPDKSVICGDDKNIIFVSLPDIEYRVYNRTPMEWLVDRYNRKVDKDSGIVNDPLAEMSGQEVIDLIRRLVHIGVESDRLIASLPKEFEPKDWEPKKTGMDQYLKGVKAQATL